MRNLKKILALVLALIMSLSLMATASAGSFQDVTDDNPYKTAIDVLDELKVFQGYKEDGTFRPTETLNRAQAAVLVYRVATGDVEDKYVENYTYMAQSKFNDLDGYNWAKGYINYCQNAKIVVGTSATTFSPEAPVTGYQLMVMLLRTLGYGAAGEFTDPKGWELETAKIAEREGLLKNVTGGDFGNPAPRQMVAEILFRGLLHDTVQYSPLTPNGYTESGEILGKRVGLEEVTGVVVANEWANLEGSKPLAEGKTILKVDGKNRTIDVSSTGADLGTSVHAYLKGATVLAPVEDSGDNVIKTNEGAETTVKKLQGELDITADTEYFVNYGEKLQDTSDWRLEYKAPYEVTNKLGYDADDLNGNSCKPWMDNSDPAEQIGWQKVIRANTKISAIDLDIMQEIFELDHAKTDGVVYAGTETDVDRSDKMTWKQFKADFLNIDENAKVDDAAQGESLRIIDNNGDGDADYVLKVEFVMTTVKDYDKKTDSYLVEYDEGIDRIPDGEMISASAIKAMDGEEAPDLSTKAVILYAKIDGVYYTKNPVVETMTIDKKGIDTKNDTFTVDGEDHIWSGIDRTAAHYYNELKELAENAKYNFYLDFFGNARLACEANKGFVLMTDGYYWSNRRDEEKQVELYDDAAGKLIETKVVDYKENSYNNGYFINEERAYGVDIDDAWLRLRPFGYIYSTDKDGNKIYGANVFTTNVAAYTADEETYSLFDVTDSTATPDLTRNKGYNAYEIAGTKDKTSGTYSDGNITVKQGSVDFNDTELYGIAAWNNDGTVKSVRRVQTTSNTQYYYVTRDTDSKHKQAEVTSWVGYNNVPAELKDETPMLAYVVSYKSEYKDTKDVWQDNGYDVAEVVVFEEIEAKANKNAWLVFAGRNNIKLEYSLGVDPDGSGEYGDYYTELGVFPKAGATQLKGVAGILESDYRACLLKFYDVNGKVITKDFADYGIYVGTINTRQDVDYQDYITFGEGNRVDKKIATADDLVEYRFIFDSDETKSDINAVDAGETTRLHNGDRVIYMLNSKGEIALVVNLDDSCDENGRHIDLADIPALYGKTDSLYNVIKVDQDDSKYYTVTADGNLTVTGDKLDAYNRFLTSETTVTVTIKKGNDPLTDPEVANLVANSTGASVAKSGTNTYLIYDIKGDVNLTIKDAAVGKITSNSSGAVVMAQDAKAKTLSIRVTSKSAITMGDLEGALESSQKGDTITLSGKKAIGDADANTLLSLITDGTLKLTVTNADKQPLVYTVTLTEAAVNNTDVVTVKFVDCEGAYDAAFTQPIENNSVIVPSTRVYLRAQGTGKFTRTDKVDGTIRGQAIVLDAGYSDGYTVTYAQVMESGQTNGESTFTFTAKAPVPGSATFDLHNNPTDWNLVKVSDTEYTLYTKVASFDLAKLKRDDKVSPTVNDADQRNVYYDGTKLLVATVPVDGPGNDTATGWSHFSSDVGKGMTFTFTAYGSDLAKTTYTFTIVNVTGDDSDNTDITAMKVGDKNITIESDGSGNLGAIVPTNEITAKNFVVADGAKVELLSAETDGEVMEQVFLPQDGTPKDVFVRVTAPDGVTVGRVVTISISYTK